MIINIGSTIILLIAVHSMEGYGGKFCFITALPMYPTILESFEPREVIYANLNHVGPPAVLLGSLKRP